MTGCEALFCVRHTFGLNSCIASPELSVLRLVKASKCTFPYGILKEEHAIYVGNNVHENDDKEDQKN
jgi:hypothetical protein